jgi:hypothetical protein
MRVALPFRFHDDDECSTPGQRLVQPLRIDVRLNGQRVVAILGPGVTRVIGFSTPDPSFDLMLKPTGIAGGESRVEDALIPELGAGYDIETNDVDLSRAILDARTCAGLQETAGYGFRVVHSGVNGTRTGVNTSPRMLEQAIRTCSRLAGGARRSSARA